MLLRAFFSSLVLCLTIPAALAQQQAREYPIKDVTEFVSGGNTVIEISQSETEYLRVEADESVMGRVKVDQTGKRLSLWVKSGNGGFFDWFVHGKEQVKVTLHVKQLTYLELSGGAQANIGTLMGNELDLEANGAAQLNFAQLTMGRVNMELSGAANIVIKSIDAQTQKYEISGASAVEIKNDSRGEHLDVDASGASKFRGAKIKVRKASLDASGASHVEAAVSELLTADASGASNIHYYGNPKTKIKTSGASNINAR
jgi:hypothetical protein